MVSVSASKSGSLPPLNYSECIGIVCNGQMESSPRLEERIRSCGIKIGVDGGGKHLLRMNIKPTCIIGDFDSITPEEIKALGAWTDCVKLDRAKDVTDLEAAIEKTKAISAHSLMIIFSALGGRIDHTLGNIYLLLRNPGQAFIDSEHQMLFAINADNGRTPISWPDCQTFALCDLTGTARNITITTDKCTVMHHSLKGGQLIISPFSKNCFISVEKGELLVCLDKRVVLPMTALPEKDLKVSFLVEQPIITILQYLVHQASHFSKIKLISKTETLLSIQQASRTVSLASQVGQTISLIPLFGPVTGITTKGLKWELGGSTVHRLDGNFIGISNISMKKKISIRVTDGLLLCIINREHIDQEMVRAKKKSSKPVRSKL